MRNRSTLSNIEITDDLVKESLHALPRADAPEGFNRLVWSRIEAERVPTTRVWWLKPALVVTMAFIIAAVPLAFMLRMNEPDTAFSDAGSASTQAETAAAGNISTQPANTAPQPSLAEGNNRVPEVEELDQKPALVRRGTGSLDRLPTRTAGRSIEVEPAVTSIDRTISPVRAPLVPRGMPTPGIAPPPANIQLVEPPAKVSVKEVLQMIGIEPEFDAGVWRARSVAPSSLAGRSGIVAGEIIEAIDNVPLNAATELDSGFAGKRVTVRRSGRSETVELRNP